MIELRVIAVCEAYYLLDDHRWVRYSLSIIELRITHKVASYIGGQLCFLDVLKYHIGIKTY